MEPDPIVIEAMKKFINNLTEEDWRKIRRQHSLVAKSYKKSKALEEIERILNEDAKQRSKLDRIRNVVKKVKWAK